MSVVIFVATVACYMLLFVGDDEPYPSRPQIRALALRGLFVWSLSRPTGRCRRLPSLPACCHVQTAQVDLRQTGQEGIPILDKLSRLRRPDVLLNAAGLEGLSSCPNLVAVLPPDPSNRATSSRWQGSARICAWSAGHAIPHHRAT